MIFDWIFVVDWYNVEAKILSPLTLESWIKMVIGAISFVILLIVIISVVVKMKNAPTRSVINNLITLDCLLKLPNLTGVLYYTGIITSMDFCGERQSFTYFTNLANKLVSIAIVIIRWVFVHRTNFVLCPNRKRIFIGVLCGSFCILVFSLTLAAYHHKEENVLFWKCKGHQDLYKNITEHGEIF